MDDLPQNYDAIVIGTGMIESIVAAALSRIGKSVLHIDSNDYYGENWASFNLENLETWIETFSDKKIEKIPENHNNNSFKENEKFITIKKSPKISSVQNNIFMAKECDKYMNLDYESSEKDVKNQGIENEKMSLNHLQSKMKMLSKRFNLDLCPKLLFSKGPMVELLISSNISKYAEFKCVSRVLTWRENKLELVPCSRSDVFATKNVSVVQKRLLVKMLTLFANYTDNMEEFMGFENKSFMDYLMYKKLPENLIHYILYAIAMGDKYTLCLDGVKACKTFIESLGRYGNTPFIFPLYGSGELPQCFCRLCAVFGGIYCLKREVESLIVEGNKCIGIMSNGLRITAENFIFSSTLTFDENSVSSNSLDISRAILITDRSILPNEKDSLTLLQFPPVPEVLDKPVTVIELGSGTNTCPENFFVVHLTTKATREAPSDLKYVIQSLFEVDGEPKNSENCKPRIIWSLMWNTKNEIPKENHFTNIKICTSSDAEFDYTNSINEAKKIFNELYPDEEFLPRAPDPDEIILDVQNK